MSTIKSRMLSSVGRVAMICALVPDSQKRDKSNPEYVAHMKRVQDDRYRQIFRSCNDGNPKTPHYAG